MLGFSPLSSRPFGTTPTPPGPFVRPAAANASVQFLGLVYTPTGDATWKKGVETTIAAVVPVVAAGGAAHGVAGSGVATVAITAALDMDFTMSGVSTTIEAVVPVVAAGDAAHGVAGSGAATVGVTAAAAATHGVAGSISATVAVVSAGSVAHGVAADAAATVTLAASIQAVVERYELRGEVRLGGILVNRRVRAYRRDTGALVNEADTVAGRFRIHAGFESGIEFTVLPIDLANDAIDWTPPVANRVLPELAFDA